MTLINFLEEKQKIQNLIKRRLKAAKKYLKNCENIYLNSLNWPQAYHEAELIQAFIYHTPIKENSLTVFDWVHENKPLVLKINPDLTPQALIKQSFKRAKKLKNSLEPAEKEYKKANQVFESYQNCLEKMAEVNSKQELEAFKACYPFLKPQEISVKEKVMRVEKPYRQYFSENKTAIWVGKNAVMNDKMTFSYANGHDYWLHASGVAGSHIIIRTGKSELDEDTLQKALQLALFFSKAQQSNEGEVCLTKVKHVKRLGKQKGQVQISNEKRFFVRLDKQIIANLRNATPLLLP